jgi:hypothetical protein
VHLPTVNSTSAGRGEVVAKARAAWGTRRPDRQADRARECLIIVSPRAKYGDGTTLDAVAVKGSVVDVSENLLGLRFGRRDLVALTKEH